MLLTKASMSPSIADLETWWLKNGFDYLVQLVDIDDVRLSRQQVGFVQAIQGKLRTFDSKRDIYAQIQEDIMTRNTSSDKTSPRRLLGEATRKIFRRTKDGGLDHDLAFEGLAILEQVETQRLRLLKTTMLATNACSMDSNGTQLIEELHHRATERYRQFQLGFRACVSPSSSYLSKQNMAANIYRFSVF